MKHIKTLGLLAIAAMALVAFVGTTSASATTKFTAGKVGAKFITTQIEKDKFTVTGSNVEFSGIEYEGTTAALESTEQTVMPVYSGCTAFGFSASVTPENCKYILTINGTVHIERTNTSTPCKITITVANVFAHCMVTVTAPQTVENALSYTNGANNDIVITTSTNAIKAMVEESTGLCPLTVDNEKEHTSEYHAKTTVQAEGTTLAVD